MQFRKVVDLSMQNEVILHTAKELQGLDRKQVGFASRVTAKSADIHTQSAIFLFGRSEGLYQRCCQNRPQALTK